MAARTAVRRWSETVDGSLKQSWGRLTGRPGLGVKRGQRAAKTKQRADVCHYGMEENTIGVSLSRFRVWRDRGSKWDTGVSQGWRSGDAMAISQTAWR
jgi:hypothetical protein